MRKMTILIISLLLIVSQLFGQQSSSVQSNLLESKGIMSFRPMDIFTNPYTLMDVWIDEPMPLSFYTDKEKEVQKLLNEKEDGIIAYSPRDRKIARDIDKEHITPYTWKWIHFEMKEDNGGYKKIYLRRPNWWIKAAGIEEIGQTVYLSMYEIGAEGDAKVLKISPNQLDTRLWDEKRNGEYADRPITGKIEHYANNVTQLYFDNKISNPLSVTTNHLIWSFDRNGWFSVEELKINERIKTNRGNVILTDKVAKEGWFKVYDLEVYKDHNFLVSHENILAHNGCIFVGKISVDGNDLSKLTKDARKAYKKPNTTRNFATIQYKDVDGNIKL